MAALLLRLDQAAGFQLRQVRARGLRRDRRPGARARSRSAPAGHQRGQHIGAGGIADQRGNHGDVGTCFHSSMLAEALTSGKPPVSGIRNSSRQREFPWPSPFSSATSSIRSSAGCSRNMPGAGLPSFRDAAATWSATGCRTKAPTRLRSR